MDDSEVISKGRVKTGSSINARVAFFLFFVMVVPSAVWLALLESSSYDSVASIIAQFLVLSLVFNMPLARFISWFLVRRELREVNNFCTSIKEGKYTKRFYLPNETEDEHELIALKRNMNCMCRLVQNRQVQLKNRLSEAEKHVEHFEKLSLKDPLTGIRNRRFFDQQIVTIFNRWKQDGESFYLVMIDADKFKEVNDTLGHQEGDRLLINLAEILKKNTRKGIDFPCRLGGDEFCVIFQQTSIIRVLKIANRIRNVYMVNPIGNSTLSIGIAHSGELIETKSTLSSIIAAADDAVYRAKESGGNSIHVSGSTHTLHPAEASICDKLREDERVDRECFLDSTKKESCTLLTDSISNDEHLEEDCEHAIEGKCIHIPTPERAENLTPPHLAPHSPEEAKKLRIQYSDRL